MQLYDMHTHILPEFDDGAKTVEESLTLLESLKKQGITNVCLTPHFYTNEISLEDFLEARKVAFEKFKPSIPEDMSIVLGTEVYITRFLFSNKDLSQITYGKSKYILTEFGYTSKFSEKTMNYLYQLRDNYGLLPIMPHVERYPTLMENPKLIEELQDMGVIIQTNIQNYSKKAPLFRKRKLLKYINEGLIDILGSDTHAMDHNSPEVFSEAVECIVQKCGQDTLDEMMETSEIIFKRSL